VLRVAAISFLNPAPLLYNFEHEPLATTLARNYALHYTTPAQCARQLIDGTADLGLIPIASLTSSLAIVPGCTIASLHEVRSILLLVKNPRGLARNEALQQVRSIAADAASRSSQAYLRILFEHFHHTRPALKELAASPPLDMLAHHDAALLIGDPALLAREQRNTIDPHNELLWLDLAQLWHEHTGLPWVAAVWAVRPEALMSEAPHPSTQSVLSGAGFSSSVISPSTEGALASEEIAAAQLTDDLLASRDAGLAHIPQLVAEWAPRLPIARETIHTYLTHNIHYTLDTPCLDAIRLFRKLASGIDALPPLNDLRFLE
jgi:chorismate dehydratase